MTGGSEEENLDINNLDTSNNTNNLMGGDIKQVKFSANDKEIKAMGL